MIKYSKIHICLLTLACFTQTSVLATKMATIFLNVPNETKQKVYDYAFDVSDPDSKNYGSYLSSQELFNLVNVPDGKYVAAYLDQQKTLSYVNHGDNIEVFGNESDVVNVLTNLPSDVSQYVYFIEGTTSMGQKIRHGKKMTKSNNITPRTGIQNNITPDPGFVGRETIARIYGIPFDLTVSTSSSVALIEFSDGGFGRSDYFEALEANNVVSTAPQVIIGEDDQEGTESSLDVQMVGETCPNVTLWYIDYDNTAWIPTFATNVSNMNCTPNVVSVSYGWSSFFQCQIVACGNLTNEQYLALANYALAKLACRGVTTVVSSGDSGSPSREDAGCVQTPTVQAEFPSSSPFVLSVGGVFIVNLPTNSTENFTTPFCQEYTCATGNATKIVENRYIGWASGAGFDYFNNRSDVAPWQDVFVKDYQLANVSFPNDYNVYGVSRPDVVGLAHNAGIFMSGQMESVDGTSMSSPIVAGMIGLLNDKRIKDGKPVLGFVNQLFYKLKSVNNRTFVNHYIGNTASTEELECSPNYGFFADGTTVFSTPAGLGSPNFARLYDLV